LIPLCEFSFAASTGMLVHEATGGDRWLTVTSQNLAGKLAGDFCRGLLVAGFNGAPVLDLPFHVLKMVLHLPQPLFQRGSLFLQKRPKLGSSRVTVRRQREIPAHLVERHARRAKARQRRDPDNVVG
jgi:hypothetical protein